MEPKVLLSDIAKLRGVSIQYIHKLAAESSIPTLKVSHRAYVENPDDAKNLIGKEMPKKVICIQTSKGGVGKTTLSSSIGVRLWSLGAKVLFFDIDQQANLTKYLLRNKIEGKYSGNVLMDYFAKKCRLDECLYKVRPNMDLIPSSQLNSTLSTHMIAYGLSPSDTLPHLLKELRNNYDFVIFDTTPAISHINTSATYSSDLVISPIDPDDDAVDGMNVMWNEVKQINKSGKDIEFRVLLNKYDQRTIMSSDTLAQLQELNKTILNGSLYKTIIGVSQEYATAKATGTSIFDAVRSGKAAKDIDSLVSEILGWG